MSKKIILQAIAVSALTIGCVLAALDPATRMEKISELFSQYGTDTFKILNGQDFGGVGDSESGKGTQTSERADIATIINSTDGDAFVFCVADSKWVVYPPDPMKLGTDAMTMVDATGKPFVPMMIQALRNSPDGIARHVPYTAQTPDGRLEKREAIVVNSRVLLKRKNKTGQKFFCGTSVKVGS